LADREELPIFRPRFGKRSRRAPPGGSGSLRNAVLALMRRGVRGPGRGGGRVGNLDARRPGARRVVVKAHVVRLTATGAKAASLHLRYIERDGVEKDGSKGILYDAGGPAQAENFEQPRPGEKHQFRLIVSPEDAGELDLTEYVRSLMARVERDLGRKLEWAAVNHHDTEHPHAHIVIRGVDRDDRELRLDRSYISNGLRWRAQELATEEIGPRLERDIRRVYAKEVTQERFTSLDRELERRTKDSRVQVRSRQRSGPIDDSTLVGRLEHLEQMRLAEQVKPNEWVFTSGWQQTLRDLGSRGDIIKQIHAAISGDPARYHVVRAGHALPAGATTDRQVITGRVASKGLSDELKGVFYAVVETPNGRAYHVPLDARSAEGLRPGDIVSLTTKPEAPVRPVDRHIADVASKRRGLYELDQDTTANAQRAGRRMRDLERLDLASRCGTHRWTIAPNLLEELERRHREAPARHRLLMHKQPLSLQAQVRHPGPVWLDRIDTASLAPYGLGAELHRAIDRRRDALRHIGIADGDPNKFARLRELERRSAGKDVAASSCQGFVVSTPNGFRGRVLGGHSSPTGTAYTVVSDGERFVLLKSTPSLRGLQGKSVTLARDAKGRLVVRELRERGLER
jgi:type IV secretory pathway VirD2 relaxase